jgi:hypothetical protein
MERRIFIKHRGFNIYMGTCKPSEEMLALAAEETTKPTKTKSSKKSE